MADEDKASGDLPRFAQRLVVDTLSDTPIAVIQGARQVGKSTLARHVVRGQAARVLSLDTAANYNAATADPEAFVRQTDDLLVIDEVQRVPALVRALKDAVDEDRRPGRFLITGSANLLQIPGTEESLAGRAETIELFGLSQGELRRHRERFIDLLLAGDGKTLGSIAEAATRTDLLDRVCAGSYPEPLRRSGRRRNAWFDNYLERIVTRDARDFSRLAHLDRLPSLLRILAANPSGELNKARVAKAAGIPETSLSSYLDLLEAMYLTHSLPPWGDNLTKRAAGRPKVSLLDTGLVARLNNLTPGAMASGSVSDASGGLLESFVAGELRRQLAWADVPAQLFHFRDRNGPEVDVVIESADRRVAGIEVKASSRVMAHDFRGLTLLRDKLGERFTLGVVLHTGSDAVSFGERLWALPCAALWS